MPSAEDRAFLQRAVETSIRIGLIALLAAWCFQVVRPFLHPIVWGVILAVAMSPLYRMLARALGGRERLAAIVLVAGSLLVLLVPSILLMTSIAESVGDMAGQLRQGDLAVPPPPEGVADWPLVGARVHEIWKLASENLEAALRPYHGQLLEIAQRALTAGLATGVSVLMFALSIALAGVFLAYGEAGAQVSRRIALRLVPESGDRLADLAGATVQSVTRGILGVALIQAIAAGIGMLVVGVPGAGLWALLVLLAAVVQLPTFVVLLPVAIYVFASSATAPAVLFAIWSVIVGSSDNVLKPLLLGRGLEVPTMVIFVGAIGGFILDGIIGLFVGPVLLAVGYKLFMAWLDLAEEAEEPEAEG